MPYRIEYASTGRASCHGPKPCAGSKIEKGALRLGTLTEIQGHTVVCSPSTTERVLEHIKTYVEGKIHDLSVDAAFEMGHLRDEDVTPALRDKQDNDATEPKKSASKKRAKTEQSDDDEPSEVATDDDDIKPLIENLPAKRTRKQPVRYAPSSKKKKRSAKEEDAEEDEADEVPDDEPSDDSEASDVFDSEDQDDDDDEEEYEDE